MKRFLNILCDCLLAVFLGLGIGLILIIIFALIGGLANGLQGALEASRGVVLLSGGFLLFFSGILMLKGGNIPPDAFSLQPWKQKDITKQEETEPLRLFRTLPRQYIYALMAFGILTTSLIPESIVLFYL